MKKLPHIDKSVKKKLDLSAVLIIFSAALASFMSVLDTYIVSIAMPTIAESFNVSLNHVSKIMIVYALVLTTSVLLFGKLGDKIGLKKIFILGFIIFTAGSFLCGIAPTFNILIISRAIQAIGAAMLYSMGLAITPKFLPPSIRGLGYGVSSTFASLGIMLGNPLGGFITAFLGWHWIFFINIPIGILAIFVAMKALPAEKSNESNWSFDLIGTILLFISIPLLIFTINSGQTLGWFSLHTIATFLFSIFFFILFIIQEKTCSDPLLNLTLFKNKIFVITIFSLGTVYGLLAGSNFLLPFLLEKINLLSPSQSGLILMIYGTVFFLFSPFIGRLTDKINPAYFIVTGAIILTFNMVFFAFTVRNPGLWPVIIFMLLFGAGFALFISPSMTLAMNNVPEKLSGSASSLVRMVMNLGLLFGVAIFQVLFSLNMPKITGGKIPQIMTPEITSLFYLGFEICYTFASLIGVIITLFLIYLIFSMKKNCSCRKILS